LWRGIGGVCCRDGEVVVRRGSHADGKGEHNDTKEDGKVRDTHVAKRNWEWRGQSSLEHVLFIFTSPFTPPLGTVTGIGSVPI